MYTESPFFSIFLSCLFINSLLVRSHYLNPVEDIDQTKNVTRTAADRAENFIDGTTSTLNDTKNAAENAIHGTVAAINNTIEGTTSAVDNTKKAAESVISDTTSATKDAYQGVRDVANVVHASRAHRPSLADHQECIKLFLVAVLGLCFC
ncbi:conserved hypothetical protein [Ricinus communis]|uniref:Uncharacterized protein n=1 Tax=Ricinus communis TaxID=3988 RepID=B9SYZ8_RICCO|nr:conserved hypothetical protein [Ricinus communis]